MWDKHVKEQIFCGALRADIVRGDIYNATAIVVRIGDGEPWFVVPFGHHPAQRLIAIDERYFIALGDAPNWRHCIAVFDAVERRQTSPVLTDREIIKHSHLVPSQDGRVLWLVNGLSSRRWSLPDLTELAPLATPFMHVSEAVVRDDGAILAKGREAYSTYGERPKPALFMLIAPDGQGVTPHGAARWQLKNGNADPHSDYALSADGRKLMRPHEGSILLTDADGAPVTDFAGLRDVADTDLIATLQRLHLHGAQEIWSAAPMKFEHRVVVRSLPLIDCMSPKPDADGCAPDIQKRIDVASEAARDKKPGDPLFVEYRRLSDMRHQFIMARWLLKYLVRYAEASPFDRWSPGEPEAFQRGDEKDVFGFGQYVRAALDRVRGLADVWTPDGAVLRFPDGVQRSLSFDGALGPIEEASPPPSRYARVALPEEIGARARRFIQDASIAKILLASLDEDACIAAIEDLAGRIEINPLSVIWGSEMKLVFDHAGGELDEEKFFALVAQHSSRVVPSLRRLMAAFDAAKLSEEVWSSEIVSASGFPALALAKLDAEAFRYLDGYFLRRDPGHEPWGLETVFPALAPFCDAEGLRFGLDRLFDEQFAGHGHGGDIAARVVREGQAFCAPTAFVAVVEKLAQGMRELGHEEANITNCLLKPLRAAVGKGDAWRKAVSAGIAALERA